MSDVEQWEHDEQRALKQATPHEQLIDELRDSTIPKTEREHAAAREIEKNQDRIAAGHRLALELECLLMDTKDLPTVSRWWESGMEALDAWQKLFPYNGPDGWSAIQMRDVTTLRCEILELRAKLSTQQAGVRAVLKAAVELVCAPSWAGVSDEDCRLEQALRVAGFVTPNA